MDRIVDYSRVDIGDIILIRPQKITSKAISFFSRGPYSHAMICYTKGSVIEALQSFGVCSNPIPRSIYKPEDRVAVFRYPNLKPSEKERISIFLRNSIGSKYGVIQAIQCIFPLWKNPREHFCSRLAALAYEEIGIKIVENPWFCIPTDIYNSVNLKKISDAVRPATSYELKISKIPNPIVDQSIRTNNFMDEVFPYSVPVKYRKIWPSEGVLWARAKSFGV
ncbi:YiiX/YebB-like N1pC/P60 family cysteine hydrolase [Maridesulfovibrio sp.]|uniref:YiiX/YebB-like N1pC/P60 family cysteine hydrolase n=1 Tax=Maridesulfovibrio sp. TaxID=2795000 RepID=UPI003B009172